MESSDNVRKGFGREMVGTPTSAGNQDHGREFFVPDLRLLLHCQAERVAWYELGPQSARLAGPNARFPTKNANQIEIVLCHHGAGEPSAL